MIIGKQSGLGRGLGALIPPKQSASAQAPSVSTATHEEVPSASPFVAPTKPAVSGPPRARTLASGLGAPSAVAESKLGIMEVPIASIETNPRQPRKQFDHGMMDDLIASVKAHGILQPVLVTRKPDGKFQLIAGERRLRAATLAGLLQIPVVMRDSTEQERLELALIENIQRQDLNPLEEAYAYEELNQQFGLTQEEIGKKVGKSRSQISNTVRLLQLPEPMRQALMDGRLSASNARTLLALESEAERSKLFEAMVAGRYTVREAEEHVAVKGHARVRRPIDANLRAAEEQVRSFFQCKVKIKRQDKGDGEIKIRFYSDEELQAILEKLHGGEA